MIHNVFYVINWQDKIAKTIAQFSGHHVYSCKSVETKTRLFCVSFSVDILQWSTHFECLQARQVAPNMSSINFGTIKVSMRASRLCCVWATRL